MFGGLAVLCAAGAMTAPYALADVGSTADQGYPCATQPPGETTPCTTTTTTTTPGTTTTVTTPGTTTTTTTPGGVAGASTTTTTGTTTPAPPTTTSEVLGAGKTIAKQPAPVLAAQHATGTLPFTGVQLGVFVAIGVLLIAGGLVLRASGRSSRAS
jgi:hypothetical protein